MRICFLILPHCVKMLSGVSLCFALFAVLSMPSVHGKTFDVLGRRTTNDSDMSMPSGASQMVNGVRLDISSPVIMTFMGLETALDLNYTIICEDASENYAIVFSVSSEKVAILKTDGRRFIAGVREKCRSQENVTGTLNVTISGVLIGRGALLVMVTPVPSSPDGPLHLSMDNVENHGGPISYPPASPAGGSVDKRNLLNSTGEQPARFMIITMRKLTKLDTIFQAVMVLTLICVTTAMGCKTEMEVLKTCWKRPVAPGIGLFCQFVAMPLIAFSLTRVIPFPSTAMAVGFFACGCAPGGGVSNLYAYMLGGDVSLSVAMTTISNIVAIGTFPMWIFTLGSVILSEDENLKIPYLNIIISLLMIALPLAFGVFLNYKFPNFVKKLLKLMIPVGIVLVIALSAMGIYLNLYAFQMIKPVLFLAGALLPYLGYICGLVLALVFKQSWKFAKTIAIETGVQNVGIAFIMVMFSFPPPDGFIAAIAPVASSLMTPIPLLILAAIYHTYLKCFKKASNGDGGVITEKQNGNTVQQNGSAKEKEAMIDRVSTV